ncbi:MAG: hypothetical protein AAF752_02190, partial [Bacteroidota bacterium]
MDPLSLLLLAGSTATSVVKSVFEDDAKELLKRARSKVFTHVKDRATLGDSPEDNGEFRKTVRSVYLRSLRETTLSFLKGRGVQVNRGTLKVSEDARAAMHMRSQTEIRWVGRLLDLLTDEIKQDDASRPLLFASNTEISIQHLLGTTPPERPESEPENSPTTQNGVTRSNPKHTSSFQDGALITQTLSAEIL